jgi:hypothetical protein
MLRVVISLIIYEINKFSIIYQINFFCGLPLTKIKTIFLVIKVFVTIFLVFYL